MASPALSGVFRSLRLYYGDPERQAAMDRLHSHLVAPGDLVFDIGAHVGDRVASFRRLGARVVALEPQPLCFRALRLIHGRADGITLVQAAAGRVEGQLQLRVNSGNPTVSTGSPRFVAAAAGAKGWEDQVWDQSITVPCTTLDSVIARHGKPRFIKIDVEGFESEVLAGLSFATPALSFEFTTIRRSQASPCLQRLLTLGPYRFNFALGENKRLELPEPVTAEEMAAIIAALPHEANSGDIYAVLAS